eukprot:566643-Prymnesium_polylepis.1
MGPGAAAKQLGVREVSHAALATLESLPLSRSVNAVPQLARAARRADVDRPALVGLARPTRAAAVGSEAPQRAPGKSDPRRLARRREGDA